MAPSQELLNVMWIHQALAALGHALGHANMVFQQYSVYVRRAVSGTDNQYYRTFSFALLHSVITYQYM